jgi:hypothetical protein
MTRVTSSSPRPVSQPRVEPSTTREARTSDAASQNPMLSTFEAFNAFNPLTAWTQMVGASMSMFSPLGYGAMRGPLGY